MVPGKVMASDSYQLALHAKKSHVMPPRGIPPVLVMLYHLSSKLSMDKSLYYSDQFCLMMP